MRSVNARIGIFLLLFLAACQDSGSDTGIHTLISPEPYDSFRSRLIRTIADNDFQVSSGACGKCSIKTIEIADKDTEIITIYRPELSLRMMQAGSTAGSDAPLRFYLGKQPDGGTKLTYHQPSKALAVYNAPDLKPIGLELDAAFAKIIRAVRP